MYYIELAIKEMNEENSSSSDTEDSVLRKLLKADKRVAVVVISDLLLAGVDTVRNKDRIIKQQKITIFIHRLQAQRSTHFIALPKIQTSRKFFDKN